MNPQLVALTAAIEDYAETSADVVRTEVRLAQWEMRGNRERAKVWARRVDSMRTAKVQAALTVAQLLARLS